MSITTPITTGQTTEGDFEVKLGDKTVGTFPDATAAAVVEEGLRRAYATGRRDQQKETSALLKSVVFAQ